MSLLTRADDAVDPVVEPPLSQAVGYVVVIVIGLIIAFGGSLPTACFLATDLRDRHDLRDPIDEEDCRRGQHPHRDVRFPGLADPQP